MRNAFFWTMVALVSHLTFAASLPQPTSSDARIREVMYDASQVYEVRGNYRFTTTLEFEKGETVEYLTLGDTLAWQAHPMGNRVHLKPVEPHAVTNLTVITDKRTYYFRLTATNSQAKFDATYLLRFRYPDDEGIAINPNAVRRVSAKGNGGNIPANVRNCRYSVSGTRTIDLKEACDDGIFTYLKFGEHASLPAIYSVDPDGNEALVNYRLQGKDIVLEQVGSLYTLRSGNEALCLFNDEKPFHKQNKQSRTPITHEASS